jgi:hypothetical protein
MTKTNLMTPEQAKLFAARVAKHKERLTRSAK